MKLYANKNKIHKNWQNINSKVQLAGDLPEMTGGCRMHAVTMTPIVAAIVDRVMIVDPWNFAMQCNYLTTLLVNNIYQPLLYIEYFKAIHYDNILQVN